MAIGVVVAIVGFCASVAGVWGPFWPTDPEIHPQNTVTGSSVILPFTVQNHSILFPISNAELTCGIAQVYLQDTKGDVLSVPDLAFANGTYSVRPAETINYPCDVSSGLIGITSDGTRPTIQKMCIWIAMDYRPIPWLPWTRHFSSVMFQWPAAPGQNQWLEGPVYHQGEPVKYSDKDYGSPNKIVDCNPTPPEVYKRFKNGNLEIIKDGRVTETR